jgi:hypothetical protein
MSKKLSLLLALVFLCVQMFSIQHIAEHGFLQHKHGGKACEIFTFCEQGKIASADAPVDLPSTSFYFIKNIVVNNVFTEVREYSEFTPRAPPAAFLS